MYLLPIASEGNVFRGVCLFTGVYWADPLEADPTRTDDMLSVGELWNLPSVSGNSPSVWSTKVIKIDSVFGLGRYKWYHPPYASVTISRSVYWFSNQLEIVEKNSIYPSDKGMIGQ